MSKYLCEQYDPQSVFRIFIKYFYKNKLDGFFPSTRFERVFQRGISLKLLVILLKTVFFVLWEEKGQIIKKWNV